MAIEYNFKYMPLVGKLSGESMVRQTETAINEIAQIVNENTAQAKIINTLAEQANANSVEALEKANEALETSGRVYLKETLAVDLDNYCESQLIYVYNTASRNLPVAHKGFLEVKTNDDKTQATQVFVDDVDKIIYIRTGKVTAQPVGDVINYVASYGDWVEIPTIDLLNSLYLPLSGGTMKGWLSANENEFRILNSKAEHDGMVSVVGGEGTTTGACLYLYGTSHSSQAGRFVLSATDGANTKSLRGQADGTLTWNGQPLLPVGIVQAYAGTTIPNGWLLCDGSAVSRTDYAALYAVIGTTYGAGNGSTTFNLPNLIDRFVQGNATAGTVKSAGLPNITGAIGGGTGAGGPAGSGSGIGFLRDTMISGCFRPSTNAYGAESGSGGGTVPSGYPVLTANLDASRSSSVYGNSTTVQPPALTMRYIIKY